MIEYLHEQGHYQLSLVRPDDELLLHAQQDSLPANYQPTVLRYEQVLCPESCADRLTRQLRDLPGHDGEFTKGC